MDFYKIRTREKKGSAQVYPDWVVDRFDDLMVRGGSFYAIWNEKTGLWSKDEFDVVRYVDEDLIENAKGAEPALMRNFGSGSMESFNKWIRNLPTDGNYHPLDSQITFANTEVKKKDYVSKRLPYPLEEGKTDAWDELLDVLYSERERDKIEWSIGAIVAGDSKWIQKFLVFYGPPGSGKSTIIGIIEKLFEGYVVTFEAKALTSGNSTFSLEAFASNPLVAIQHDGDLSRIEDNTKLNTLVSHETIPVNMKYRSTFDIRPNAFIILGTNKPVRITDAKSGNTRRLIDVYTTGAKIDPARYHVLMENVKFELGAIAHKCLARYREMGRYYYEGYIPTRMMGLTDPFYNFVEAHYDIFKSEEFLQLKKIWELYKQYCEEANITRRLQYHEMRDELQNYFEEFKDRHYVGEKEIRSVYIGFKGLPTNSGNTFVPDQSYSVDLRECGPDWPSWFDHALSEQPAQYAKASGTPGRKWATVTTHLGELDTSRLHFVKVPYSHIVIDFDLVDEDGEKDLERNLEAASKLPPTYTELSQSGKGVHLHYIYAGDVEELDNVMDVGVEIKTLLGDSSLRRKLTLCNNLDATVLTGGLPRKEKKVIDNKSVQSERSLRELVERNLRKDIHPGTKPSVDFIAKILQEAYDSGLQYDLTDMRPVITAFALNSTHHSSECLKIVQKMKFASESEMPQATENDRPIVFFDVEVYPNLFVCCWKIRGSDQVVRMINPTAEEIEQVLQQKLVGFNNRRYDNHILYARYMGYSLEDLFELSQKLIYGRNNEGLFGAAYDLSWTDIYDFSSKKQGLKKWEIELCMDHMELDLPWDQPVDEADWPRVVDYCVNDVLATEGVFEARYQDYVARMILADLSGLSVNHTTQQHTARIIFGNDKNPQKKFVYTDLSEMFPGYSFNGKESEYRGENPSEGGYVYSEPGYYENVVVLDIASMHPTSIIQLNLFGPYTGRFQELTEARLAIKAQRYEDARQLLGGKLDKYLASAEADPGSAQDLAYALKIVINIVYGLTSASFDNAFRDNRNKDNIVAKRGALFMINLKHEVQDRGFQVVHIKTDSIKIPNATEEIIDFITEYGKEYGYAFEHETTYDRFCLVNDAVYVARDSEGTWTAVGAQFQHPYVFKQLFSAEPITFADLCETRSVTQGVMYLRINGTPRYVGRTGRFMPVRFDGGELVRVKDGKEYAVTGTKGYQWIEAERANYRDRVDELFTDMDYFKRLEQDAIETIEQFVPYDHLVRKEH